MMNHMTDRFDVVIIGMGPAGLQCARTLKNTGKSVLIIDRKKVIGPKPCGGGLTYQDEPFGIPDTITRPAFTHVIRIGTHETVVTLKHRLRSVTRLDLGQFLLKEIQNVPNITILTETRVTDLRKDSVLTDKGTFFFKNLVGADGTDSLVRKFLKLPKKITLGFTFDVPVHSEQVVWYFNPPGLMTAYLWSFPKQENVTNVGGYYDPDEIAFERVLEEFKAFMDAQGWTFDLSQMKGAPLGVLYKGVEFGNIFLAGEAAGLTEALTGEGIAFALASGQEVAKRILDPAYPMPELERIVALKHRRETMLAHARAHPRMQPAMFKMGAQMLKSPKFQAFFGT